jgi:hypothetical protein
VKIKVFFLVLFFSVLPIGNTEFQISVLLSADQTNKTEENVHLYNSLEGKSFQLSEDFKPYVTNSFYFDPYKRDHFQLNGNYEDLKSQSFKVLETGVVTAADLNKRRPIFSEYRYYQEEIDGELYKRDKTYSTKVLTDNGSIFYLGGGTKIESLLSSIVNTDNSKIDNKDIFLLFGDKPFEKLILAANVEFDKFLKIYNISTPFYNDILIRGSVDAKTNQVINIQLYADLVFRKKWGNIDNAVDTDGNSHKVTKISTDIDVDVSPITGSILTETIAISLNLTFLEKHRSGFEIKAYGTKEQVITVPGQLIESFLLGINDVVNQSKK